jgi:hypothetical protein
MAIFLFTSPKFSFINPVRRGYWRSLGLAVICSASLVGCNSPLGGKIGTKPDIAPFLGDRPSASRGDGGYNNQRPTGTVVGEKVARLRSDLGLLQDNLANHNTELMGVRQETVNQSQAYHGIVAAINSRLQIGTTPGNPVLVQQWTQAQQQLEFVGTASGKLNNLANTVAGESSFSSYLLDSVRSTYSLSGGIDEDHRQLAILEDEVNRTIVLIDRLLREIREDVDRQGAYVGRERLNLNSLALAVGKGSFTPTVNSISSNIDGLGRQPAALAFPANNFAPISPLPSAPLPSISAAAANATTATGLPFVIIRFDKPSVAYESELQASTQEILRRSATARFDVIAVAPLKQRGSNSLTSALKQAEAVKKALIRQGIVPDRISIGSKSSGSVLYNEVQVFAS